MPSPMSVELNWTTASSEQTGMLGLRMGGSLAEGGREDKSEMTTGNYCSSRV